MLTATTPKYQTILDLDQKVRERTLPHYPTLFSGNGALRNDEGTPLLYLQGHLMLQLPAVS